MNIGSDSDMSGKPPELSDEPNNPDDFEKFIYILSHDIRASARALLEIPQWIEEDLVAAKYPLDESLVGNLKLMNTHARRLDQMLIDLLSFSRVGRMQTIRSQNLSTTIQSVLDQAPVPTGFSVKLDMDHECIRMGDRDILTLFSEIISNSVKHHHQDTGTIEISSRLEETDCVICVRDDGPGIPTKFRMSVFEAMKTLKSRDEVEGSGMGLTTVRKIVGHYDGTLRWLEIPGKHGACLEMRFPA